MDQTLGKRISSHRKKLGMTQDQLAEKLGVTAQAVSKWENDQSCPDIAMLPKLAEIFGVTTDYLLTGRPIALPDQKAVTRLMRTSLESAQTALSTRRDQPFTRNELAALFAAMLTDA